jgi:hypothetical protein
VKPQGFEVTAQEGLLLVRFRPHGNIIGHEDSKVLASRRLALSTMEEEGEIQVPSDLI